MIEDYIAIFLEAIKAETPEENSSKLLSILSGREDADSSEKLLVIDRWLRNIDPLYGKAVFAAFNIKKNPQQEYDVHIFNLWKEYDIPLKKFLLLSLQEQENLHVVMTHSLFGKDAPLLTLKQTLQLTSIQCSNLDILCTHHFVGKRKTQLTLERVLALSYTLDKVLKEVSERAQLKEILAQREGLIFRRVSFENSNHTAIYQSFEKELTEKEALRHMEQHFDEKEKEIIVHFSFKKPIYKKVFWEMFKDMFSSSAVVEEFDSELFLRFSAIKQSHPLCNEEKRKEALQEWKVCLVEQISIMAGECFSATIAHYKHLLQERPGIQSELFRLIQEAIAPLDEIEKIETPHLEKAMEIIDRYFREWSNPEKFKKFIATLMPKQKVSTQKASSFLGLNPYIFAPILRRETALVRSKSDLKNNEWVSETKLAV